MICPSCGHPMSPYETLAYGKCLVCAENDEDLEQERDPRVTPASQPGSAGDE